MRVVPRGHGGNAYAPLARPSSGLGSEAIADTRFLIAMMVAAMPGRQRAVCALAPARIATHERLRIMTRQAPVAARHLIGASPAHVQLLQTLDRIAPIDAEVLISRPTGVGDSPNCSATTSRSSCARQNIRYAKNPTRVLSVTRCSYAPAARLKRRVNVAT